MTTAQETPVIRLDRSREFSEIHGDREPNDPFYRVSYWQNGLPFGADELLVPDDGQMAPMKVHIEREDGTTKVITHQPLYTKEMRETVARRIKKIAEKNRAVAKKVPERFGPVDPEDEPNEGDLAFGNDEVNLTSWLRGEMEYEPNEVFNAVKKRYGKNFNSLRVLIEDLVIDADKPIIPEAQLADRFRQLFEPDQA